MAYQQKGNNPRPAWTVFEHPDLQFKGVPWTPGDYSKIPRFVVKVIGIKPGFSIYLNNNDGKSNSNRIPFIADDFFPILAAIEHIATNEKSDKIVLKTKVDWENGIKLEKLKTMATVTIGRDTDGIVYLGIHLRDQPQAIFQFLPSYKNELLNATGERLEYVIVSSLWARGWVKRTEIMVGTWITINGEEPKKREQPNNGYQQRQQSSGGNNSNWDDDIPF